MLRINRRTGIMLGVKTVIGYINVNFSITRLGNIKDRSVKVQCDNISPAYARIAVFKTVVIVPVPAKPSILSLTASFVGTVKSPFQSVAS
jgi:hypothetical protein